MAKKSPKPRNNVNFQNKKVQSVVSYLQLGENRISKDEVLHIANKDILYQMKNAGYIKETSRGNYQGTPKLHKQVTESSGKHFATSASPEHAASVRGTLQYLPQSILSKQSFQTSFDVEKYFNRFKNTDEYKSTYSSLMQEKKDELEYLKSTFNHAMSSASSPDEQYILKLEYINERDALHSIIEQFEEGKPYLTPDYEVTMNEQELSQYIITLEQVKTQYDETSLQYRYLSESIQKLESLEVTGEITIAIEVVTNAYANREIEMHRTYEKLITTPQIMLYAP